MTTGRKFRAILVLLLIAWGVLLYRLDAPWWGLGDENGAWISTTVRNYQRYGAAELKGLQVTDTGPVIDGNYDFYNHHPPLVPWVSAIFSSIFGFTEASLRLWTAAATLISIAAFYVLCRRLTGHRQAIWGAIFYTLTPMMLYYGRMPDHEALALALTMTFMAVFVKWVQRFSWQGFWLLLLLAWLAVWTAWATVIFMVLALALGFWMGTPRQRMLAVVLVGVILLAVVVLLGYYQLAWPGTLEDLMQTFVWRVSDTSGQPGSEAFTLFEFIGKQFIHLLTLFTPALLIFSFIGAWAAISRAARFQMGVILVLTVSALLYIVVFRNAAFIHDYYKIYFAPGLALLSSYAANTMVYAEPRRRRFTSPIFAGLAVSSIAFGIFFWGLLHQSGERPYLDRVREVVVAETAPQDVILMNDTYAVRPLAYYTFRTIGRGVSVEQAQGQAANSAQPIFYIYCGDPPPAELAEAQIRADDSCGYYWLN